MTREEAIALLTERVSEGEQVIMFLATRADYAGVLCGDDGYEYDVPVQVWDAVASLPLVDFVGKPCVIGEPAYSELCEDIEYGLRAAWTKWVNENDTEN